ncbi:hypothetical protein BSKO_06156 [Bryopsis sp. KO-2023]|nr:hypothetical protein BSKO_06156 [Bryopsis sp. KO-2023]
MNGKIICLSTSEGGVWSFDNDGPPRVRRKFHHNPSQAIRASSTSTPRRIRRREVTACSISPSGRFPNDLNPVIHEVMNRDVQYLQETDTIRNAIQMFLNSGISGAPVVDADGQLVGVLSESDVITRETGCRLEQVKGNGDACSLPQSVSLFQQFIQDFKSEKLHQLLNSQVKEIMTRSPVTVDPSATIFLAAKKMIDHKINRLPVVEGGELVGILTRGDVLQCMIWELLVAESESPNHPQSP